MPTNVKENGFESSIVSWLVQHNGYEQGSNADYNKEIAMDETRLFRFLNTTQADKMKQLRLENDPLEKEKFLQRLDQSLHTNGVIDLLRKGFRYKHLVLDMFYVRPSPGNETAAKLYAQNIFSVTRQLQYSRQNPLLALDVCLFLNGLPIATMELKNQLTKQNAADAVKQYKDERTPDEVLFGFKRCIVHFAVDDNEVRMCTELKGQKSWFLPFNKGYNDGAGNPPNPDGIKTDYLWKEILRKDDFSNIIENYVQIICDEDEETHKKSYKQIFPRYHQLQLVTSLLADAKRDGVGKRYLIQHSAGSGKSNSIAWLAHQLVTLKDATDHNIFDTVIVVTDRVNLDKQIRNTIRQFMQVSSTVGWAKDSSELGTLLEKGTKIIITIVHKFQFILEDISKLHTNRSFAILIDEAHSSQNGDLSTKMNIVLSGSEYDNDDLLEDTFKKDPYRILIVANKFQTGFDEPLLHTMYVDKGLSDIKAVQTLSRLNRSAPDKNDTFILDFVNDPGVIKAAFDKYYKTTILSGETDVNKLNDQISEMESLQVYTHEDVDSFVEAYLDNAPREELDPILDRCTENYKELIPEEQILFKSNAKGFVRTYNFLSAILPYGSVEWEKLSIFLKLLIGKLPSPAEDDNISGLLEDIDLESYRAVAQDTMRIQLDNENGELNPIPVSRDVGISVPELDPLTQILKEFHDAFGGIDWTDEDKVKKQVADLPAIVSKDEAYQNAIKNSDAQNARVESDRATMQAILDSMSTTIELYKAVNENPALCKWIQDMVFANTYQTSPPAKEDQPDFD